MYLTVIAVCLYAGLLAVNFTLAGISYHISAIRPLWALAQTLNRISVLLIVPAVLIDLLRLIF